jgi:DNA-3-methyladenine glycosylase I
VKRTASASDKPRCWWCGEDALYCEYHDKEWGVPVHDDRKTFEMLILEGFQAGLSWITILRKRENFRKAFKNFDARKIARFGKADVARLMNDAGIIRNRLKIEGAVTNAKCFLAVQKEFSNFDRYIWGFTGNRTLRNPKGVTRKTMKSTSPESDALSKDLKARGFKFVGPTVCHAHMQATGMVDDHVEGCFKYKKRGE